MEAQSNEFGHLLSFVLSLLLPILLCTITLGSEYQRKHCRSMKCRPLKPLSRKFSQHVTPGIMFRRYLISSCRLDNVRPFLPISNLQISKLQLLAWQGCRVQNDGRCGRDNSTRYQSIDYSLYMDC